MRPAWQPGCMSRPAPPTCKPRYRPAGTKPPKRRGLLTIRVDPAMTRDAAPGGSPGRKPASGATEISPPRKNTRLWEPDHPGCWRAQRNPAKTEARRSHHPATMKDTTAKAAQRCEKDQTTVRRTVFPAIGCPVSSSSGSACPPEASTARLRSAGAASQCGTASMSAGHPQQCTRDRSVREKRWSAGDLIRAAASRFPAKVPPVRNVRTAMASVGGVKAGAFNDQTRP
jgi:hypothetical protein